MAENKLSVFSTGNGDSILLEAHGYCIMTDVHYRARAEDDSDNDALDFADELRKACSDDRLDLFVLTHPDKDHLRGFDTLFHCGAPEHWDDDPDDGEEPKILVDEIWCTPYGADPNYVTEEAKPLIDEIQRRKALQGKPQAKDPGNKLRILDADTDQQGSYATGIDWWLHAPTKLECDIPKPKDDKEPPASSNPSSFVIRWTVTVGGGENHILVCGDTTADVLERLHDDVLKDNPDTLAWHILVAPHHCSRHALGRVEHPGKDEEFKQSDEAIATLSEQRGDGFIISSSNRFGREKSPPSIYARNRYWKILSRQEEVTDAVKKRFLCTGGDNSKDDPQHVVFHLTPSNPTRAKLAAPAVAAGVASSSTGRGGTYG